ncbi:hypothetical protein [Mariniflexile sp. AS56]|uniref:hypothetical protein n=1 Tax=Mariniflexile sp. AS56 TaxID=3063957 RepID=UPI0026EDE7D2|nr:hypothetical protein [Mariniflexile sp. AS56]MDO7172157.1 hypothetical protein [Mariniflexile sp. AS56]
MMRVIFYLPTKSINDATEYYVNLIRKAFVEENIEVIQFAENNFEITSSDYIFTIRVRDFIDIYRKNRKAKIIMWFQGVGPEEYLMLNNYSIKAYIIYNLYNIVEKITIRKSFYNLFVSERMQKYLKEKHSYNKKNYTIIPCYNKNLLKEYFDLSLKPKSTFVYAGSLYSWQCFEKTISLYKEIELKNKNAFLTILTKEVEVAEAQIKELGIKNYDVFYVELKDLEQELSKHKYGFILREDHIINNVATPTKMNTYLSVGLMPIYTNVIDSFSENLNLGDYEIKTSANEDLIEISNKIIEHDDLIIDYNDFYDNCKNNFAGYYDDDFNINKVKKEFIDKNVFPNS